MGRGRVPASRDRAAAARRHQGHRGRRGGVGGGRATGPRHPLAVRRAAGAARHRLSEPVEGRRSASSRPIFRSPDPAAPLVLACTVAERGKPPAALLKMVDPVGERSRCRYARKELEPWLVQRAKAAWHRAHAAGRAGAGRRRSVRTSPSSRRRLNQLGGAFEGRRSPRRRCTSSSAVSASRRRGTCATARSARTCPGAIRVAPLDRGERRRGVMVLGGIAARVRDLIRVRALPDRTPPAQVAKQAGLRFDWQARRYQQQARNFTPRRTGHDPRPDRRDRPRAEVGRAGRRRDAGV